MEQELCFFWLSFEQGASSLVLFARDNVDRALTGNSAIIYNIVNTLLTVIPLIIISWVLFLLWKKTFKKIPGSNIVLVICFLFMWVLVGWMIQRDFNTVAYDVTYQAIETTSQDEEGNDVVHTVRTKRKGESALKMFITRIAHKIIAVVSDIKILENSGNFNEAREIGYKVGEELLKKAGSNFKAQGN